VGETVVGCKLVGNGVGDTVVGLLVGIGVGGAVGNLLGGAVGQTVGAGVGAPVVGILLGTTVGIFVDGAPVKTVGASDFGDGDMVVRGVGSFGGAAKIGAPTAMLQEIN